MAIAWAELTEGSDATLGTTGDSAITASITPTANAQVFVAAAVAQDSGTATNMALTVSGCNLAWEEVGSFVNGRRRIFVWRGTGASPTTGALTLALTTVTDNLQEALWSVDEATGVDSETPHDTAQTGTQASGTSCAVDDVGTPGVGDHIYAAFMIEGATVSALVDDGTVLTNLGGGQNVRTLVVFYDEDASDETPSITWTGTNSGAGLGFIVNAAVGGGGAAPVRHWRGGFMGVGRF